MKLNGIDIQKVKARYPKLHICDFIQNNIRSFLSWPQCGLESTVSVTSWKSFFFFIVGGNIFFTERKCDLNWKSAERLFNPQFRNRFGILTLFRQELYFPDVEVGNHWATCDVIIFDVTRLFWKQLTQQGQVHPYVCSFWISTKFWQSYTGKNVSNFGCRVGGKITLRAEALRSS